MSDYGLKVKRSTGELAIHSSMPSYVFDRKSTQQVTVTSVAPPLVFCNTATYRYAFVPPTIEHIGANTWRVSPSGFSVLIYPNDLSHTSATGTVVMYIFVVPPSTGTGGHGLKLLGTNNEFLLDGSKKPLIIKKRLKLDPNTATKALNPALRSIYLGSAYGSWAASVGGGSLSTVPFLTPGYKWYGKTQFLRDSQGYFIGGIAAHLYISGNTITTLGGQHTGPEANENTQIPNYIPVNLIHTGWYG